MGHFPNFHNLSIKKALLFLILVKLKLNLAGMPQFCTEYNK